MEQNFTPSTELIPLSQYAQGQSSLEKFSEQTRQLDLVENFKSRGLRNEDIQLALDLQRGEDYVREKHKVSESAAFETRLADVKMKLAADSNVDNNKLDK